MRSLCNVLEAPWRPSFGWKPLNIISSHNINEGQRFYRRSNKSCASMNQPASIVSPMSGEGSALCYEGSVMVIACTVLVTLSVKAQEGMHVVSYIDCPVSCMRFLPVISWSLVCLTLCIVTLPCFLYLSPSLHYVTLREPSLISQSLCRQYSTLY